MKSGTTVRWRVGPAYPLTIAEGPTLPHGTNLMAHDEAAGDRANA